MLRITVSLSLIFLVCADQPIDQKSDRPKQFRYVDDEEPQRHREYASAQRQVEDNHKYDANNDRESHNEYGVDNKQVEPYRPLVSVNREGTGMGRNVGVGVNLGRLYQMDLKQDNNFGSKAVNLGLNVLNGLVKVNVQRERDPFSGKRGPILVQLGGHTIYSN